MHAVVASLVLAGAPHNQCIERTAGKRCLPVRIGLRPTPAAHAQRFASARCPGVSP
jgi:hypothetical protein